MLVVVVMVMVMIMIIIIRIIKYGVVVERTGRGFPRQKTETPSAGCR